MNGAWPTYRARVMTHEVGDFAHLRDARVLIYWPHGFGDWVFLSYVLPLLEPSNRYWVTRFGDDTVSLMDGDAVAVPLRTGVRGTNVDDGAAVGHRHFGLRYDDLDGSERDVRLPPALYAACAKHRIDVIFWSSFPETAGYCEPPYHTKARNLLRFVRPPRDASRELPSQLRSSLSFDVPVDIRRSIERTLRAAVGPHARLCIVGRNGYTSVGKNWGHRWRDDDGSVRREGAECRDFMRIMRERDPRWHFIVMEDRIFAGDDTVCSAEAHAWSYAALFGSAGTGAHPFATIMKVLAGTADLCVGVPAGPYHLAMAHPTLPTVGIWIEHLPHWFDEPKATSIHVLGQDLRRRHVDRRPASIDDIPFRYAWSPTRTISGIDVAEAAAAML